MALCNVYAGDSRKGISRLQLAKELGISQKSCWFMLHRLREACDVEGVRLEGEVEVDETHVRGSLRRMQHGKKPEKGITHWKDNKTIVVGMRQRDDGRPVANPVEEESVVLSGEVLRNVERGSTTNTDTNNDYKALNNGCTHEKPSCNGRKKRISSKEIQQSVERCSKCLRWSYLVR